MKIRFASVPTFGKCFCGGVFVERVARRGELSGQSFLGCSRFPECVATREFPHDDPDGGEQRAYDAGKRLGLHDGSFLSWGDIPPDPWPWGD